MKRIVTILLAMVLAVSLMITPAFAANGGAAAVSAAEGRVGTVVYMEVSISGFADANTLGVTFEASKGLELVPEECKWLLEGGEIDDLTNGYGAWAKTAASDLNGSILKLAYKIVDKNGPHSVKCTVTVKNNKDVLGEASATGTVTVASETTPMYRLFNPNTGEHFYTGSVDERETLVVAGWAYEGVAWNAPIYAGEPVYRLYAPGSGDHHYTMSAEERDMLVDIGWNYEGVCWNSASPDNVPQYRLYNPNASVGSHHYTGSTEERDFLVSLGWHFEGIGWFGTLN